MKRGGSTLENILNSGWNLQDIHTYLNLLKEDGFSFKQEYDESGNLFIQIDWRETELLGPLLDKWTKEDD